VAPDGCPLRDTDGDGILDKDDKCVTEPETRNGWEDTDGCPDEIPKAITKFTGVIKGIYFDFNKATIKKNSAPTLDAAAKIFKEYPGLKVEVSGHTDDVGTREYNVDLAQKRADSVKQYLVDRGVAADRIKTRGAGPDEPIADNTKAAGRAKNRRIEFKILIDSP
jgi:outer membrane protein OmpA-like peptidoglycan-associated protein